MLAYKNINKGWGLWKITLKKEDSFIGWVLIRPMHFFTQTPAFTNIEIGWRFKQSSWGQGYATEAASALCNALKMQPEIKTLSAMALADNKASISVMQKLGFTWVKNYIHTDEQGDLDGVLYAKAL